MSKSNLGDQCDEKQRNRRRRKRRVMAVSKAHSKQTHLMKVVLLIRNKQANNEKVIRQELNMACTHSLGPFLESLHTFWVGGNRYLHTLSG